MNLKKYVTVFLLLIASISSNLTLYSTEHSKYFIENSNEEILEDSASGYGEISNKTGRAKTVRVKGYTKKDGTYVKPYYRSPPKRK